MKPLVLVLVLVASTTADLVGQSSRFTGRALADVLGEIKSRGLNIVFSSELVRPEMRVAVEPKTENARRILDDVLRPHGLVAKEGVKGVLTIVRVRMPRRVGPDVPNAVGLLRGRLLEARTGAALAAGLVQVESTAQQSV